MTYYAILEAARKRDETALKSALSNTLIDTSKPGKCYFTAVAQLALDNDTDSVNFLLEHGANKNYAAYGAALGVRRMRSITLVVQESIFAKTEPYSNNKRRSSLVAVTATIAAIEKR